jgi:hypothetical protein
MILKKFKFVKVDDFYVIIDDHLTMEENFPIICVERLVDGTYSLWQIDNLNDYDLPNQFKIVASTKKFKGIPTFKMLEFDALTAKQIELVMSEDGVRPKTKRGNKLIINRWLYD